MLLFDSVCHYICAIGKKTAHKWLPLIADGNNWHAAAAALLIGNLMQGTWLEWQCVGISMISGGSGSFAKQERQVLFQSRKFQNGYGMYCLWRNK